METTNMVGLSAAELEERMRFAEHLADLSGAAIRPHFRQRLEVENKAQGAGFDPVTRADRAAEEAIRAAIRERYPDDGIIGEEHGREPGSSGRAWVIDPIDGTRAFLTGVPLWGTLIGLFDGRAPVIGLMDQPFTGERFVAAGDTAVLVHRGERTPLRTRDCAHIGDAVIRSTHPRMFARGAERDAFEAAAEAARLTLFGGDCYSYCMLAMGFVDAVIESGLKVYDILPLIPVIHAAGGVVSTWHGEAGYSGGQIVACGDADLHRELLEILAPGAHRDSDGEPRDPGLGG